MEISNQRVQEVFEEAKTHLEEIFKLRFSLIEQNALRRYSRVCLEEHSKCGNENIVLNYPTIPGEAEHRFMGEYYGFPMDQEFLLWCDRLGWDNVIKHLHIVQENAHLL